MKLPKPNVCIGSDDNALSAGFEFALGEVIDHLQSNLWLVHRNHMSRLEDLHEMEAIGSSKATLLRTIHGVWLVFGRVKIILVGPVHCQGPLLVPEPVADVINISCVNENIDAGCQHVWNLGLVILHPICLESHVDDPVAAPPFLADTNGF